MTYCSSCHLQAILAGTAASAAQHAATQHRGLRILFGQNFPSHVVCSSLFDLIFKESDRRPTTGSRLPDWRYL